MVLGKLLLLLSVLEVLPVPLTVPFVQSVLQLSAMFLFLDVFVVCENTLMFVLFLHVWWQKLGKIKIRYLN